jgi:GTP cyclohydrolase I
MSIDRKRAESAIAEFLLALGHDPAADPELRDTPERVVAAFADDLLQGYSIDVAEFIARGSSPVAGSGSNDLIMVRDIKVATLCPHHLIPALGSALIAYLPGTRLLGLGTISGVVDAFARRLTLQESIGSNVVQALMAHGGAQGAYCLLRLTHGCLSARGQRQVDALVETVASAGALASGDAALRLSARLGQSP